MDFQAPHYQEYAEEFKQIAQRFDLDPKHLKVEFYLPRTQAILIEQVENQEFKIHINLEENRIISFQRLTPNGNGNCERIKNKYRRFMK